MISFKQFDSNTVKTTKGYFELSESISHIEDLPPEEFFKAVKNIAYLIATEKLDGANQVVGFDNQGRMYTSREMKGGERMYEIGPARRAADNGFRAAHAVLQKVEPQLKEVLNAGEAVEIEILFGRQPNAIVYGSNYIAFLRAIPGDNGEDPKQAKVRQLTSLLAGKEVHINLPMITTNDGLELIREDRELTFKFAQAAVIDNFEFHKVDLKDELAKFESWLKANPPSKFKTKKAFADEASKFMLPIKEKLLDNVVRKIKPALRDTDVEPSEDFGIEGVVVLDPETGKQFKLVDKSVFTLINQFNHAIRNQIKQTSHYNPEAYKHLYKIFNAALGEPGHSIYDNMLANIARVIGQPELGKYMNITRALKKFDSLEDFVHHWPKNLPQLRAQVADCVKAGADHLEAARLTFTRDWKKYSLMLNSGRELKYTTEIFRRTLMTFAETRKEMNEILQNINSAKSIAELANAIYGKQLKAIHNR